MKTKISLLTIFSFLLFLPSCYTYFFFNKPLPPEINIEPQSCKISFVNLFDYSSPAIIKEKQEAAYHAGINKLAEGLQNYFSGDSSFHFIIGDTLRKGIAKGFHTLMLPEDTIKSLCKFYKSDMLLTLDSLSLYFDWDTNVEKESDGSKSKTKTFYLVGHFFISLYNSDGNLINRSKVDRSSFYKSREALSVLITIKPSLARARGDIENLALSASDEYVRKFYSSSVQESRKLYTGKLFAESNSFIFRKEWSEAVNLLNQLTKNPDKKIAEKALHNLSVINEAVKYDNSR